MRNFHAKVENFITKVKCSCLLNIGINITTEGIKQLLVVFYESEIFAENKTNKQRNKTRKLTYIKSKAGGGLFLLPFRTILACSLVVETWRSNL